VHAHVRGNNMQLVNTKQATIDGLPAIVKINRNGNVYVVAAILGGCISGYAPYTTNNELDAIKQADRILTQWRVSAEQGK